MPPSPHWILALIELIYFIPSTIPLLYILYSHRHAGSTGWIFFLLFIALQCAGSGMIVSAGQNGTPSSTAIIIVQVGLSTLILGIAGVVHEVLMLSRLAKGQSLQRVVRVVHVVFHLAVLGAVAIYAVGASGQYQRPPQENAQSLYRAGVMLLLVLFIALCVTFMAFVFKAHGTYTPKPLIWSIGKSLLLLTIRIIYSVVSAFNKSPNFNPVTGSIAYQAALVFLPGALVVAAMITGGVTTTHLDVSTGGYTSAAVPMASREAGGNGGV